MLYAPGLTDVDQIGALVKAVGAPVNVLALSAAPSVGELAAVGVRRVSTGSLLASSAYGALLDAVQELADAGTAGYAARAVSTADLEAMLGDR